MPTISILIILLAALSTTQAQTTCQQGQHVVGTTCVNCPIGKFRNSIDTSTSTLCQPCPRGTHAPHPGQSTCTTCPPATYQDNIGASSCLQCRTDSFNNRFGATSAADCTSCSEAKRWSMTLNRINGTDQVHNCLCPSGRVDYGNVASSPVERCQLCPIGSDCKEKTGLVLHHLNSSVHYWRQASTSSMFYKCLSKYNDCIGGGR